jgi:tRNA wybutosine-synthesizing protein 3
MAFLEQKKDAINNLLAAEAVGDLDMQLKPLLDAINALPQYYTTSSCSGRAILIESLGGKGLDSILGKWHGHVKTEDVVSQIKPCGGTLWFRFEGPILHVMATTTRWADEFLHLCRESGLKRSGIQSLKQERILVEALSTERVDAPIMAQGKMLVAEGYMKFLVGEANAKYDAGLQKLMRLQEKVQELH